MHKYTWIDKQVIYSRDQAFGNVWSKKYHDWTRAWFGLSQTRSRVNVDKTESNKDKVEDHRYYYRNHRDGFRRSK